MAAKGGSRFVQILGDQSEVGQQMIKVHLALQESGAGNLKDSRL